MPATAKSVIPNGPRRLFLRYGLAGIAVLAAAGGTGLELVSRGVLPGKYELDRLDGACSVPAADLTSHATPGPQVSGAFFSHARNRAVGYTIGYPPGHRPGAKLPLIVMLHGYGGNHTDALSGLSPAQALALRVNGTPLPPMAMVTVDGGPGYWNPRPGDNPLGMLTNELIPRCQRLGLGTSAGNGAGPGGAGTGGTGGAGTGGTGGGVQAHRIGVMGISMGGYGALLLAEKHPDLVAAVAAISPAIWTSYAQARSANAGAYASAADFTADDAVTHAAALAGLPVRVASGYSDPFYPGVQTLARALPKNAVIEFSTGCHDGSFFTPQEPPSLAFLAGHLT